MQINPCELHTTAFLFILMFGVSIIYLARPQPKVIFVNHNSRKKN